MVRCKLGQYEYSSEQWVVRCDLLPIGRAGGEMLRQSPAPPFPLEMYLELLGHCATVQVQLLGHCASVQVQLCNCTSPIRCTTSGSLWGETEMNFKSSADFLRVSEAIHCALYKAETKLKRQWKVILSIKTLLEILSLSLPLCPLILQIILWIAGGDPIVDAKGWENVKLEMTLVLMMTLVLTFYVKSIDRERRVSPQAAFCFTLMWCLCSLFSWERWRLYVSCVCLFSNEWG